MKFTITIITLIFFTNFSYAQKNSAVEKVKSLLHHQSELWNNGDIEGFMEDYWKSEKLVFLGSKGPIYGWQATLDRYKKNYPDRATMGKLKFDLINVDQQSRKVVSVVGKFYLTRPEVGDLSGYFLLILRKIKGKWLIVADHTSS